jgi:hypothetical protein
MAVATRNEACLEAFAGSLPRVAFDNAADIKQAERADQKSDHGANVDQVRELERDCQRQRNHGGELEEAAETLHERSVA